jgi:hypothetical protein
MKFNWFNRKGLIYWPATAMGWTILLAALVLAVYVFIRIDSRSHSVSDTLINFAFNGLIIALTYTSIAFLTCRESNS